MEKDDHYINIFMGTDYKFGKSETIKELKNELEKIIHDLPTDETLKISEVHLIDGQLGYTLEDGIPQ